MSDKDKDKENSKFTYTTCETWASGAYVNYVLPTQLTFAGIDWAIDNPTNITTIVHSNNEIKTLQEKFDNALAEIDRLRVQLAGCSVAAAGYFKDKDIKPGDYGHSASYEDVKQLYLKYESVANAKCYYCGHKNARP